MRRSPPDRIAAYIDAVLGALPVGRRARAAINAQRRRQAAHNLAELITPTATRTP